MFYFSTVQSFCPDYGLVLELHTLTLVARSYALLYVLHNRMIKWYNTVEQNLHTLLSVYIVQPVTIETKVNEDYKPIIGPRLEYL